MIGKKENMTKQKYIESIKDKEIHIVGISGTEGYAVAKFLCENGIKNIVVHDFQNDIQSLKKSFINNHIALSRKDRLKEYKNLENLPIKIRLKDKYLQDILSAALIFVGQNYFNYDFNFPMLNDAKNNGIPFSNITELYFKLSKAYKIGITGSNGKSTTSSLTFDILKRQFGDKVFYAGNDRYTTQSLSEIVDADEGSMLVLEMSNRHLREIKHSPDLAIITNITPNHLDEHGGFQNYIKAKSNIFAYQSQAGFAILNYDDEVSKQISKKVKSQLFIFSKSEQDISNLFFFEKASGNIVFKNEGEKQIICNISRRALSGNHNLENILAAITATYILRASEDNLEKAVQEFTGLKNRCQLINAVNGIKFYNDISSTTTVSSKAAIETLENNVILIAGGNDKDMQYDELAKTIEQNVKLLILLPGSGSEKIKEALGDFGYREFDDFTESVEFAFGQASEGDKILLSPACANFYSLFCQGKEGFNFIVNRLVKNASK